MLKILFILFLFIHGIIHILGFIKAFKIAKINQLIIPISPALGIFWLLSALLFLFSATLFYFGKNWWSFVAITAVLISQIVIIFSWSDAKAGSIPNIIILCLVFVNIGSFLIQNQFKNFVVSDFADNNKLNTSILTEKDIEHLPTQVQKYLRYTKSVGQPKVKNFRADFVGGMRANPNDDYMKMHSIQYNFYQNPSRYFYMTASKLGLPATGLHVFKNANATFNVKLLNWFSVVSAKGEKLNKAETVTLLNDMCFIAPATLIDKRITWEELDKLTVKAIYKNGNISVSAVLYFNDTGELINFISNDRFETNGKEYNNYPWETPVFNYKETNGYLLPSKAKLIYKKPNGDFTYGELFYKNVEYNVNSFNW